MSGKGTILVVDDEPEALQLLVQVLEPEGYRVEPADSGKLALVSVAEQPPELILLDVRMPAMDGFEVCRRLKQMESAARIPVIFLSASQNKKEWAEGLSLGAVDFVAKPFQREELLARVRTHLEMGRLQTALEARVARRTAELSGTIAQLHTEMAERRRAEEALSESEARFRQIANAAAVAIWTTNAEGQTDFCNEYAHTFTGRTMRELAGEGWVEMIHPEDRENVARTRKESARAQRGFELEFRMQRADGEYRWMLEKATPRLLANGEFAGYVGVALDLTEIRRSQERTFRQKYLENLRVFSAGIAHDFNTLVGAIFGEVDLALSELPEDSGGRENLLRIGDIARRAADVVRLLMAYVGEQTGDEAADLVDLSSVVNEIVPHLKGPLMRRVRIRTSLTRPLPAVRASVAHLRLVALNLIINAVESMDGQNGAVTVATAATEVPKDGAHGEAMDLPAGTYVRLVVTDAGQGMTGEVHDRIFDPYYSTKSLGRGMGLAAVQGIIRSLHGTIISRSVPGDGSTFEVLLPAASSTLAGDGPGDAAG